MADLRSRIAVKLVDPTTDANEQAVDASGNAQVILASNTGVDIGDVDVLSLPALPAGSNNIGDVDVLSVIPGTGATALGKAEDVAHATGDTGVFVLSVRDDTPPTSTAGLTGEYAALLSDANGRLYTNAILDANSGVDIGDVDVLTMPATAAEAAALPGVFTVVAGDDGVDTHPLQLDASGFLKAILQSNTGVDIGDVDILSGPTGASALEMQGTAADGASPVGDPVQMGGSDGTNMQTLKTDTDGNLQVDVLTGGGEPTPTNPTFDLANSTATAAGAAATLSSAEIAEAEKLWAVLVSASVPFKVQVDAFENDVQRKLGPLLFGRANEVVVFKPVHRDFAVHAGTSAGTDTFRAIVTNMDNSQAADLHCAFYYST